MFERQYIVAAVFMPLLLHASVGYGGPTYITFFPPAPTDKDQISFSVAPDGGCGDSTINGLSIDQDTKIVKISSSESFDFSPCPLPHPVHNLGVLSVGSYQVIGYDLDKLGDNRPTDVFDPKILAFTTQLLVTSNVVPEAFKHETPAEYSIQSGVSLIRGWVCEADKVEASIDGGSRILVAYGTSREDTRANCGDANNGYGMVFNWGLLSPGQHNLRIFINDNTNIANVSFETVSLGESFVTGVAKQLEVPDFPATGQSVILKWIEADQNFKIIQHNR